MEVVIRSGLLILSMLGYFLYFSRRFNIKIEFMPALFMAACGSIIFIAGILNLLNEVTILIFLSGFVFFILFLRRKSKLSKREWIVVGCYIVIIAYFAVFLKGAQFTHYDDFTHWGLVARQMLQRGCFPNFQDTIIGYQAYPLGSSSFIYYVCRIISDSESCMAFAQTMLEISLLFCCVAFIGKKNIYMILVFAAYAVYSLVANIPITYLLVDTLLPLCGVAAAAIIYYYRNDIDKAIILSSLLAVFLVTIKNSGIFFSIACLVLLFIVCDLKEKSAKIKALKNVAIFYALPISIYILLWKKHVAYVFVSGAMTKHAMSIDNFKNIFGTKTIEEVKTIGNMLLERIFDFNNYDIQILLVCTAMILGLMLLVNSKEELKNLSKQIVGIILFIWCVFAVYQLSLWLMYIFSMPSDEAIILASYERYAKSITIYVMGISLIFILIKLSEIKCRKWKSRTFVVAAFLIMALVPLRQESADLGTLYSKGDREATPKHQYQKLIENYRVPYNESYLIYISKQDNWYMSYLSKYVLQSDSVEVMAGDSADGMLKLDNIENYDYFILWDYDTNIEKEIEDRGLFEGMELHEKMAIPIH